MATRAERFKAEVERSGVKRAKKPVKPKTEAQTLEAAAEEKKGKVAPKAAHAARGAGHTAERNASRHAEKKASFALEDSATKPSRKSTRKSANHAKPESALRKRAVTKARSADTRAIKANAPTVKSAGAKKIPRKR